ncbi:MAG TPA: YbdD/YjiX family protein [Gemmatimonadaceae bacterium]|nr:YbdD/YjiX family protein [Gemmatimonadaceae bacterium]
MRGAERLRSLLGERLTRTARVLRAVLGAPDYDRYLAHLARRHPDVVPLSRAEFMREQLRKRYDEPGSRCC